MEINYFFICFVQKNIIKLWMNKKKKSLNDLKSMKKILDQLFVVVKVWTSDQDLQNEWNYSIKIELRKKWKLLIFYIFGEVFLFEKVSD